MSEMEDQLSGLKVTSKPEVKSRIRVTSMMDQKEIVKQVNDIHVPSLGTVKVPVVKGFFLELPSRVQEYVAKYVSF